MAQGVQMNVVESIYTMVVTLAAARAKTLFPDFDRARNLTTNLYSCCLLTTFFTRYYYMEGKRNFDIIIALAALDKHMKEKMGDLYNEYKLFLPDGYKIQTEMWFSGMFVPSPYNVPNTGYEQSDQNACNGIYCKECKQAALNIVQNVKRTSQVELSMDTLFRDVFLFCATAYPFLMEVFNGRGSLSDSMEETLQKVKQEMAPQKTQPSPPPTGCLIPLLIGFSTMILSVVAMVNL